MPERVRCIDFPLTWTPEDFSCDGDACVKRCKTSHMEVQGSPKVHDRTITQREDHLNVDITNYEFPERLKVRFGSSSIWQQLGSCQRPTKASPSHFYQLSNVITQDLVTQVLAHVTHQDSMYDKALDSVDGLPAFEYYPVKQGKWLDDQLEQLLSGFVSDSLIPMSESASVKLVFCRKFSFVVICLVSVELMELI